MNRPRGAPLNRDRILNTSTPECSSGKLSLTTEAESRATYPLAADHYRCKACQHWHATSFLRPARRSTLGNLRTGGKMTRDR
ncbi:MAG: hypothetical protein H7Y15_18520 [Pseudonocardia sp.]|nr:hypothetical protein [Pseudonocardia sp.]